MKQINLQDNLRRKFTKQGVRMVDPNTVFFSKDTKIGKNVSIDPYVVIGKKVKILARILSFRMQLYKKSINVDFKNIKKPIKKYIYKNKVKKNNLNNFYNYICSQHKKLKSSNSKDIFSKKFFNEPI